MSIIMTIYLGASLFMAGLVLIIQRFHYPSFYYISSDKQKGFVDFHVRSISNIVIPAILTEVITLALLQYNTQHDLIVLSTEQLIFIWIITFYIIVKQCQKLRKQFSDKIIKVLVATNWLRKFEWTLKAILLYIFLLTNLKDVS